MIAAIVVAAEVGGGDGDAELLRNVDAHRRRSLVSSILQAIGVALLAVPLYFLFRAARARSDGCAASWSASSSRRRCSSPSLGPHGVATLTRQRLRRRRCRSLAKEASKLDSDAPTMSPTNPTATRSRRSLRAEARRDRPRTRSGLLAAASAGFGLGGQLGLVVALFYTCLRAMRTGLLTRFWGSLGMALGAVSFLFFQFALLWFVYLGLLLLGWVPAAARPPGSPAKPIPGRPRARRRRQSSKAGVPDAKPADRRRGPAGEPSGAPDRRAPAESASSATDARC